MLLFFFYMDLFYLKGLQGEAKRHGSLPPAGSVARGWRSLGAWAICFSSGLSAGRWLGNGAAGTRPDPGPCSLAPPWLTAATASGPYARCLKPFTVEKPLAFAGSEGPIFIKAWKCFIQKTLLLVEWWSGHPWTWYELVCIHYCPSFSSCVAFVTHKV